MKLRVYLLLLCSFSPLACSQDVENEKDPVTSVEKKNRLSNLLFLYLPGIDSEVGKDIFDGDLSIIDNSSSDPMVQFAALLTGSRKNGIHGIKYMEKGKSIWGNQGRLKRYSWIEKLPPGETLLMAGRKGFSSNPLWKMKKGYTKGRIVRKRDEEFELKKGIKIFIPPRGIRPGAKWEFPLKKEGNRVLIKFPEKTWILRKGGVGEEKKEIKMKLGQSVSLIVSYGTRKYYLFLNLAEILKSSVVFYRQGPVKGVVAPPLDFSGLKREFIDEDLFGMQAVHGLRSRLFFIFQGKSPFVIGKLDVFSLLGAGLLSTQGDMKSLNHWSKIASMEIKEFINIYKKQFDNPNIIVTGISPMVAAFTRIDIAKLLGDPDLITINVGSQVLIYSFGKDDIHEKIVRGVNSLAKSISLKITVTKEDRFFRVKMPPGVEVGYCRRDKIECDPKDGGRWGHSGKISGWFMGNVKWYRGSFKSPWEVGKVMMESFQNR
jgi:hypothetical protein